MAYDAAEMSLGLGSVFMCVLLFRTMLIPRALAVWGLLGYAIFLTGAVAELLQIHIGLVLSIPADSLNSRSGCGSSSRASTRMCTGSKGRRPWPGELGHATWFALRVCRQPVVTREQFAQELWRKQAEE
jgi:hypothetical protein